MMTEQIEGWVGLERLAIIIEKSYPTTRKLVKSGKIKGVRVGGQYRIYESEVNRFLKYGNHPDPIPLD